MSQQRYSSKDPEMPWIVVRRATVRDILQMLRNLSLVSREEIYLGAERVAPRYRRGYVGHIRSRKSLTMVAEVDNKNVGTLWWSGLRKMESVRELGLLVVEGYREMGVGRAMIDYALSSVMRQRGLEKIVLGVFSTNKRAIKLYRDFGFKVEDVFKDQHVLKGRHADEIRMAIFLKHRK